MQIQRYLPHLHTGGSQRRVDATVSFGLGHDLGDGVKVMRRSIVPQTNHDVPIPTGQGARKEV